MRTVGLGFNATRVDRGSGVHVVIGTTGELAKVDDTGKLIDGPAKPFPSIVFDGSVVNDKWVGIWIDRELRDARIAALPMDQRWSNGPSREDLRLAISSGNHLEPSGAIWQRRLESEPIKLGTFEGNIVFSTIEGVYMIDADSNEVWRGAVPFWPGIAEIGVNDQIVAIREFPGGVSIWSRAGGVAVLDPVDGSILYTREIPLKDSVSNVFFSEGGWLVCLHGNKVLLMEAIEGEAVAIETSGPILDSVHSDEGWKLTGWRNDVLIGGNGRTSRESVRDEIGIGVIGSLVLTNDGEWSIFSA